MSIDKACGVLREPYGDDPFRPLPREFFGPAAIPIGMAAISLFSAADNVVNQNKAAHAAEALQGQEEQQIGQQEQLANNIANAPIDLSGITRAGQSGIETLKSDGGGVANLGAMIKQLFGNNNLTAMTSAIGQKQANENTAAGILNGTNGSINQLAGQAGTAASNYGNPWAAAAGTVLNTINGLKNKNAQPVVTGPGTQGGGDVTVPSPSSASYGPNIPTQTGFDTGGGSSGWTLPSNLVTT